MGMLATAPIAQFKFSPPSQVRSFLNLPGSFEYLLTGGTSRPRLPDELLCGGARWKKAFDRELPLVSRISRESSTQIHQLDSGFPTTTAAMLPSLYTGTPPAV